MVTWIDLQRTDTNEVIIIALVGIGLYAFFALVDLIRTKGSK